MRLAILYGKESDAHHHFIERASDYFDTVLGAFMPQTNVVYDAEGSKIIYKDANLCQFDAVFLRLFDSDLIHGEHIPELLADNDVYTQMDRDSIAIASNKFYTMRVLAQGGIGVPKSCYVAFTDEAVKAATNLGYPVIVKLISGYGARE